MPTSLTTATANAALTVARAIHDGAYTGIVVSGGSNQLSRALVALGWHALYPDTPLPHVFVIDARGNALLYKRDAVSEYPARFESWMQEHLPSLAEAKKSPLCFVDDFALSGEKYRGVKASLEALGFSHVCYAFFAALDDSELGVDAIVGERSTELVAGLRELSLHIQGQEDAYELLDEITRAADELRHEAIERLRDVHTELTHHNR